MEAQIILNDNAKDKKMIKQQIMLHHRKVKSEIKSHEKAALNAALFLRCYLLLVCMAVVTTWERVGGDESKRWVSLKIQSKGRTGSSVVTYYFGGCLYCRLTK